ncbi:MAG: efflux RND transporter periplasmic adaptor subunit [Pseudomonadota bacterium]
MSGSGFQLKLAAFGAAAFLLAGVVIGVAIRPHLGGKSPAEAPAAAPLANAGVGGRPRGGPPRGAVLPAVTFAAVERSAVEKRIDAVGTSRAARSVTLISEATGLVKEVRIKSGSKVAAGDVLLKIDDTEQVAALARLKAQYPIAKANSDRYAALFKEEAASRLEAEAAFNAYKAAEADLTAAEFSVSQRTIRAPFAGVIGLTPIESGDYIRAGELVTTIDDLTALIIEFTVPQESAADVKTGQAVSAMLASAQGARVTGAVSAIDSRVDALSRTLKIEATFDNSDGALLPGATYAVTTTNEGAPALALPGLAVQWDRTGAYVWKLEESAALRVGVRIIQRRDETVIAEGDLKPGDRVIVEGADRVRPGMMFPVSIGGDAQRASG